MFQYLAEQYIKRMREKEATNVQAAGKGTNFADDSKAPETKKFQAKAPTGNIKLEAPKRVRRERKRRKREGKGREGREKKKDGERKSEKKENEKEKIECLASHDSSPLPVLHRQTENRRKEVISV